MHSQMYKLILQNSNLSDIIYKPHLKENHHSGNWVGKETRVFYQMFSASLTFLFFSA